MKKLLIAGGSHADIPVIKAAKELGLWVATTGNNPNDLGHKYSDAFYKADYSNKNEILELSKNLKIDYICPSSNDFSAISSAFVAEKLNLPGHDSYEVTKIIHHKNKFKNLVSNLGLKTPKHISYKKGDPLDIGSLKFPILVKPTDLSGGKGISRIHEREKLKNAISTALKKSKNDSVVLEEFITGSNHGYSTFIANKKVIFSFMDDEHYFKNDYLVSGASTSLNFSTNIKNKLDTQLEKLANALNLSDGLLHVQFILNNNEPYIIEICRRTPGDLYLKLIEYATGFNAAAEIVKSVIGESRKTNVNNFNLNYITRHCIMSDRDGVVTGIEYGLFKNMIIDELLFYKKNNIIKDFMTYKAGIVFVKYDNKSEFEKLNEKLTSEIKIKFEDL